MQRMELSNPRDVIKRLTQESSMNAGGASDVDILSHFEQHVHWEEVTKVFSVSSAPAIHHMPALGLISSFSDLFHLYRCMI